MRATLLISVAALACAAPPPPPEAPPAPAGPRAPQPKSAEWLYAAEGIRGGRMAECVALVETLKGEEPCKGALCSYGASLARDWLRVCKPLATELSAEVERREAALSAKAVQPPSPCEAEAKRLLFEACDGEADCASVAQGWATRCSVWSTPLVVRMLEVMAQRKLGERVRIDGRSCPALLAEVAKAGVCVHQFDCQEALPAIETYQRRCVSTAQPWTLTASVITLAVQASASPGVEPLAVEAGGKLEAKLVPLALESGSGAVLMACGKRATAIDAYLGIRKACSEGEVVVARRFEGPTGPVMRVGRIAHPSDAVFLQRYPSLRLEGEPKARYLAALPAFLASVAQAARATPRVDDALRALLAALEQNIDAIRNSIDFETALRETDASLVSLFDALGAAKRKAIHLDLPSDRLVPALHRAMALPLADVDASGRVRLGAVTAAASLGLTSVLPKSVAAYREALSSRVKLLDKRKLGDAAVGKLALASDGAASRCGQAMKAFEAAEAVLLACAFGVRTCDDATRQAETQKSDAARRDAELAWPQAATAVASLPKEQRSGAEKSAELAGCREPWW